MDETSQTKGDPAPPPDAATDAAEFAALPRRRTRHPLLAAGAALLALFLVLKIRADVVYFFTPRHADDLGDARALVHNPRGDTVLAEGTNRLVRIHGSPDREGALQVDTRGSWTFSQFFRLLGTDSRLFVYRGEDPLPAFRAEHDTFEGRLLRFSDLSFGDAITAYFAAHVSATHFFDTKELERVVAAGIGSGAVAVKDLAGDTVTLGPNDIVAITLTRAGQYEIAFPAKRFKNAEAAAAALEERHAHVLGPGRAWPEDHPRHSFIVSLPEADRDGILHSIGDIDWQTDIRAVHDTVKVRLTDLTMTDGKLTVRAGATAAPETNQPGSGPAPSAGGPRVLDGIDTIRTLATIQIPNDAYLIMEADQPQNHFIDVAMALVLLVFAGVNVMALVRGLRR